MTQRGIEVGPRSTVWAEPSVVEAGAYEFAGAEEFIACAEKLLAHAYIWKKYDVLVLPPSFPYGGMENPCLTFVTPTLLAGDRSLANVMCHEVAHSWTGARAPHEHRVRIAPARAVNRVRVLTSPLTRRACRSSQATL